MQTDDLWPRWPRALEPSGIAGRMRCQPGDFRVVEQATHEPDPGGEHLLLWIEKRSRTTRDVARQLADQFGLAVHDVGYAGMKDKAAITRQWFSVAVPGTPEIELDGAVVSATLRGRRKLRRGDLTGNAFALTLRQIDVPAASSVLAERLGALADRGVPNYFGPQRFGHDNLEQAIAWLPRRRRERNAFRRGLYLSVLRSFLFNEVLAARIREQTWAVAASADGDAIEPTGPLWGRGRNPSSGAQAALEQAALAPHAEITEALEFAGLTQQRRPLQLSLDKLDWGYDDGVLTMEFELPPGGYATSVLRELGEFVNHSHE